MVFATIIIEFADNVFVESKRIQCSSQQGADFRRMAEKS